MKTNKKKVLITGCSSGFGLATAVTAAKAGFDVVATMRNLDKQANLTAALKKAGVSAQIAELDVTKPATINAVVQQFGGFDILVNNAGLLMSGSFLDISDAEMRAVFETDYFGVVNVTKAVAPEMIANRSGLIINIASLAGRIGHLFNSAYGAAKHAVIGFSRSIRQELRPFGVRVVSVEPGYFKTGVIGHNANIAEDVYDKASPMFAYNRAFLRLMMKHVIPNAGNPQKVADTLVKIMQSRNPRNHYLIGKDAWLTAGLQQVGLLSLFERMVYKKLVNAAERSDKRRKK